MSAATMKCCGWNVTSASNSTLLPCDVCQMPDKTKTNIMLWYNMGRTVIESSVLAEPGGTSYEYKLLGSCSSPGPLCHSLQLFPVDLSAGSRSSSRGLERRLSMKADGYPWRTRGIRVTSLSLAKFL